MEEKYKKVSPLCIGVLQNFPFIEEDFDSLTTYGMLSKIVGYLNEVIKNLNLVEDDVTKYEALFIELKNYVDNYFKNLDVQDEINNKLDQMAQDGTLADIIAQYVQLSSILAFNTKSDMKNATNLTNGSFAETYGDLVLNDYGSAKYKIRTIKTTDVIDDVNIIKLTNSDTLVAELIKVKKGGIIYTDTVDSLRSLDTAVNDLVYTRGFFAKNDGGDALYEIIESSTNNNYDYIKLNNNLVAHLIHSNTINILKLGAKADNSTNNLYVFDRAIKILEDVGGTIFIPNGTYKILGTLTFPSNKKIINLVGESLNAILDFNLSTASAWAINCYAQNNDYIYAQFKNLTINNSSDASLNINGVHLRRNTELTIFDNVHIQNFYDNISTHDNWFITINKLKSTYAKHDGFTCESGSDTNAFTILSSILQHNTHFNCLIRGRGHQLIQCDTSNYDSEVGLYVYGGYGVNIQGLYIEDSSDRSRGTVIEESRGVNISGSYFETTSIQDDYKAIEIKNVRGCNIEACSFRTNNQEAKGYSIYSHTGSYTKVDSCSFQGKLNCMYCWNSNLFINNNKIDSITSFITQFNHDYAFIEGYIESGAFDLCMLPKIQHTKFILQNVDDKGASVPSGKFLGQQFYDSTNKVLKIYDGANWNNV